MCIFMVGRMASGKLGAAFHQNALTHAATAFAGLPRVSLGPEATNAGRKTSRLLLQGDDERRGSGQRRRRGREGAAGPGAVVRGIVELFGLNFFGFVGLGSVRLGFVGFASSVYGASGHRDDEGLAYSSVDGRREGRGRKGFVRKN